MVAGLGRCTALFYLVVCVSTVFALPNPPRPSHDAAADDDDDETLQHTGEKPAAEGALLRARVLNGASSAVIAADIPTAPQQSQNITTTDGQGQLGVIPNLNITREEVDCTDLSTGRDNKCWQELRLTAWVSDWIAANTCYQNEAFSSCFLRKAGYPELDCTGIKLDTCTPPSVKEGMDPKVFYVAYNFYCKFFFFFPFSNCLRSFVAGKKKLTIPKPSISISGPGTPPSAAPPPWPRSTSTRSCS